MTKPSYVFDLDGTLVDTAPDLLAAINVVLKSAGRRTLELPALRRMVGFGAPSAIRQAFAATGEPLRDSDLPAHVEIFRAHYQANVAVESRPFPNVEATLAHIKAQGARLGVLTNKQQVFTDLLLPAVGLDRYFDAVIGAGAKPYAKPDPRLFHYALECMGTVGSPAVMIGDSVTDVATARGAGVPVILVSYGYTPEPARTLGADAVTDDFAEIPKLARKLGL